MHGFGYFQSVLGLWGRRVGKNVILKCGELYKALKDPILPAWEPLS